MPPDAAYRVAVLCEDQTQFDLVRDLTVEVVAREVEHVRDQVDLFLGWEARSDRPWIRWDSGPGSEDNSIVVAGRQIRLQGRLGVAASRT